MEHGIKAGLNSGHETQQNSISQEDFKSLIVAVTNDIPGGRKIYVFSQESYDKVKSHGVPEEMIVLTTPDKFELINRL